MAWKSMRGDRTLFTMAEGIEQLRQVWTSLLEAPRAWRLPFERAWRAPNTVGS